MAENNLIAETDRLWYDVPTGNQSQAAYPPLPEGLTLQTKERRALPMITYADLIQFGIFIVALVSLCYQMFMGKRK